MNCSLKEKERVIQRERERERERKIDDGGRESVSNAGCSDQDVL